MVLIADDTIFSPTDQKRMIQFRASKGQKYDRIDSILYVGGKVIFSVSDRKTGASSLQILDGDSISDQLLKKSRGNKLINAKFIGRQILKNLVLQNESDGPVLDRNERIVQMQHCPNNERLQSFEPCLESEILMLTSLQKFYKVRLSNKDDEAQMQALVLKETDLSEVENISNLTEQIGNDEILRNPCILSERAFTYKGEMISIETGQSFDVLDDLELD